MNFDINEYIDNKIYLSFNSFLSKNDRVLEIGAGFGEYTFAISRYVKEVVALDFDENKLYEIKKQIDKKKIKNIEVVASKAEDYFPEIKFDKIIIIQSLGYINPNSFISILKNNLRPDGNLLILDLTKSFFFTNRRKIKYFFNKKIPRANNYSKNDLNLILNLFSKNKITHYGVFILFLPLFFFLSKNKRLKIYNKFDKIILLKNLSFKYLVICEHFAKK